MSNTFQELQKCYIDELRELKPMLFEWWIELTGIEAINDPPPQVFNENWPFKLSGHPRLLEIFRRYYMKIEDLNDRGYNDATERSENRDQPFDWMEQVEPPSLGTANPIDLLVWDLQDVAPDIFKLAAGVVYVPVGLNQHDERV